MSRTRSHLPLNAVLLDEHDRTIRLLLSANKFEGDIDLSPSRLSAIRGVSESRARMSH